MNANALLSGITVVSEQCQHADIKLKTREI